MSPQGLDRNGYWQSIGFFFHFILPRVSRLRRLESRLVKQESPLLAESSVSFVFTKVQARGRSA